MKTTKKKSYFFLYFARFLLPLYPKQQGNDETDTYN